MVATLGSLVKLTVFGESHGAAIGAVLDGLPPGLELDLALTEQELRRRAPGRSVLATARRETDTFEILSGVYNGLTTGSPLCAIFRNNDTRSSDYVLLKKVMRPGHADYAGYVKYHGYNDYRGGGHFSGRLTASLVFAGAVAKQLLAKNGIALCAHIASVGHIKDTAFNPLGEQEATFTALVSKEFPVLSEVAGRAMQEEILAAKAAADSVGGSIETMIVGMGAGIGEPFFASVESELARGLFSIPAVKGLEFGAGFALAGMHGSEANDGLCYEGARVCTTTNHNGGVTGGITNGMPVLFRVAVKPTPSIGKPQMTIDVESEKNTELQLQGRHDPCIVPRAVPVVEGITAWILLDLLLRSGREVRVN